ncbi:MAG TPA: hypothetical protein VJH03_14615 [Blastocatellia bacterium]|nr:hypothetical protein [Blastocatellia bacterium]
MLQVRNAAYVVLLMATSLPVTAGQKVEARKPSAEQTAREKAQPRDPALQKIVAALDQLLETQKTFSDENVRTVIQVQAGDLLWGIDQSRARDLFESSFQAVVDPASSPASAQSSAGKQARTLVRDIVLMTIARRDPALAVKLVKSAAKSPSNAFATTGGTGRIEARDSLEYTLAFYLAYTDPQRAAQIVGPLMGRIETERLITLMRSIRSREQQVADDLFIQALEKARAEQPGFDTIQAMASYLFNDFGNGVISFSWGTEPRDPFKPINISPAVIQQFLELAYDSVSRRLDAALANEAGVRLDPRTYDYTIPKLLVAYFERLMPDRAEAFQARVDEALRRVPQEERPYLAFGEPGIEHLVAMARTILDAGLRDHFYQFAATRALNTRNIEQASAIIDRIGDERLRARLRDLIRERTVDGRSEEMRSAIAAGDFDKAAQMIAAMTEVRLRQWGFSSLIGELYRKDKPRALRMLDDVERAAMSLENAVERAQELMMLAGVIARLDAERGFDKMELGVAELNRGRLSLEWEHTHRIETQIEGARDPRVRRVNAGISSVLNDRDFESLGGLHFDRALKLARQIQMPEASAFEQLAVCRGALDKLRPALAVSASAQKQREANAPPSPTQQKALALLDQILEQSKSFEDDEVRIRVQAQIADLLWQRDEPRARRLFEAAFRAIASTKLPPQDKTAPPSYVGANSHYPLRSDVIRLVSSHDPALAARFVDSVVDQPPNVDPKFLASSYGTYSESAMLQLQFALYITHSDPTRAGQIAGTFLQKGDFPRAASILRPLRSSVAWLADDLFAQAVARLKQSDTISADSVRYLADYVFPDFGEGTIRFTNGARMEAANTAISAELKAQFMELAYNATAQWTRAAQKNGDRGANSRAADIESPESRIARLLLPYFDQHMPDKLAAIRAQVSEAFATSTGGSEPNRGATLSGTVEDFLSRAERATDAKEKDLLYANALTRAVRNRDFGGARTILERISNERMRSQLDSTIRRAIDEERYSEARRTLDSGDLDTAYALISELSDPRRRISMLGNLAISLLNRKENELSLQVLDEAKRLAGGATGTERAVELLRLADLAARLDPERGFEDVKLAVEAINQARVASQWQRIETVSDAKSGVTTRTNIGLGSFGLAFPSGFSLLARTDFDRALLLAQAVEPKEASALAQLAVCRSALGRR